MFPSGSGSRRPIRRVTEVGVVASPYGLLAAGASFASVINTSAILANTLARWDPDCNPRYGGPGIGKRLRSTARVPGLGLRLTAMSANALARLYPSSSPRVRPANASASAAVRYPVILARPRLMPSAARPTSDVERMANASMRGVPCATVLGPCLVPAPRDLRPIALARIIDAHCRLNGPILPILGRGTRVSSH